MHESAAALLCGLTPWLSDSGKQMVEKLSQRADALCTVAHIMDELDVNNRFELGRQLRREGLPPFDELRGWVQVIGWVHAFEVTRRTLSTIAREVGKQPSALYRRVKQVTGLTWKRLVTNGLSWVLTAFLKRCRVPKWYVARHTHGTDNHGTGETADTQSTTNSPARRHGRCQTPLESDRALPMAG